MHLVVASQLKLEARKFCYTDKEAQGLKLYDTAIRMLHDQPVYFRETGD